jgi:uncharacterized membrane protein YeaQ/YmgE (transglycosylase-associated protein family)
MNFILWLIVGGLIGWLGSSIMNVDGQRGIGLNVGVGIVGSVLAGWLITPLIDGSTSVSQGSFSLDGLITSLLGAIILIAAANLFRRSERRTLRRPARH